MTIQLPLDYSVVDLSRHVRAYYLRRWWQRSYRGEGRIHIVLVWEKYCTTSLVRNGIWFRLCKINT